MSMIWWGYGQLSVTAVVVSQHFRDPKWASISQYEWTELHRILQGYTPIIVTYEFLLDLRHVDDDDDDDDDVQWFSVHLKAD